MHIRPHKGNALATLAFAVVFLMIVYASHAYALRDPFILP